MSGAKQADGPDRERARIYRFDGFELDVGALRLTGEDGAIVAEPRALEVLAHLLERRGHLVTRDELAEAIWGDAVPSDGAIARAIHGARRLRGKTAAAHAGCGDAAPIDSWSARSTAIQGSERPGSRSLAVTSTRRPNADSIRVTTEALSRAWRAPASSAGRTPRRWR